jgi:hypothetical protein
MHLSPWAPHLLQRMRHCYPRPWAEPSIHGAEGMDRSASPYTYWQEEALSIAQKLANSYYHLNF